MGKYLIFDKKRTIFNKRLAILTSHNTKYRTLIDIFITSDDLKQYWTIKDNI